VDGFGVITDTHNLEDSVVHALERLDEMPDVPKKQKLIDKAHVYRDILASWELMPPSPEEQSETVSAVLQLLGRVMAFVNNDPDDRGSEPSQPPPASEPSPRLITRPKAFPSGRSAFGDISVKPSTKSKTPGQRSMPRRQQASKRKVSVGRIELELALKNNQVATADILFPFQRPWHPLSRIEGGEVKILHHDDLTGSHALVRLQHRVELAVHIQDASEMIYILRGGIRLAEESLFAGAVIRTSANASCPALRSIGESELLFAGTVRPELAH
jgi:hypothetical protein